MQLTFDFTPARRLPRLTVEAPEPAVMAAPKKKKRFPCLRCDQEFYGAHAGRRICTECKNPKKGPGRFDEYVDGVEIYSIAIRSKDRR